MKILIIGSGGREHALADTYSHNKKVDAVFVAPGNDFMSFANKKITTLPNIGVLDFEKIVSFAKKEKIALIDVAQDDPLSQGLVDILRKEGLHAFGATQAAAEIEWNKAWARKFMEKYHLPIPSYHTFSNIQEAEAYIRSHKEQLLFIKAAGLAFGKGVIRAQTKQEALNAITTMKQFGKSGETFLIEEGLVGEEFSLFALCDGTTYAIIGCAQDHKTIYEKDQGPNTGGMGCLTPIRLVDKKILHEVEKKILQPFMHGMQQEKRPYSGILYLGGMLTNHGVRIIEFNARWGDPEAEVLVPSITTDYLTLMQTIAAGTLAHQTIALDGNVRLSIAGCASGYPLDYAAVKGKQIFGLDAAMKLPGISLYGSGMKKVGNNFVVTGGRIFHLVAEGKTLLQARVRAYGAMSMIFVEGNNLHYRTDIGWRDREKNL